MEKIRHENNLLREKLANVELVQRAHKDEILERVKQAWDALLHESKEHARMWEGEVARLREELSALGVRDSLRQREIDELRRLVALRDDELRRAKAPIDATSAAVPFSDFICAANESNFGP